MTARDRLSELRALVDQADAAYYHPGGKPLMSDGAYDTIKDELKKLAPNDERHTRVGAPYPKHSLRAKVPHTIPMGSLDKIDGGMPEFDRWFKSIRALLAKQATGHTTDLSKVAVTLKVDGSSVCLIYEKGKFKQAITRGDGAIGEEITANAAMFRGVPLTLSRPVSVQVRGEAVLYKAEFEKLVTESGGTITSNPRNLGNGMIGRLDGQDCDRIQFMAFGLHGIPYATEQEKIAELADLGFLPVPAVYCATRDQVESAYKNTDTHRAMLPFEIDGVVVTLFYRDAQELLIDKDDPKTLLRPKYARAIKFSAPGSITVIEGVELTIGHTGAVIPTAKLKRVRVGGVFVDSALLNNWDEIARLDVALGDQVKVILAGDIIPKIIEVVKRPSTREPFTEPEHCPECGHKTTRSLRGEEGAVTYCTNGACPGVLRAKVHHWIVKASIMGIGDAMELALWKAGLVRDPADLYTLKEDDLAQIKLESGVTVGKTRAASICKSIIGTKNMRLDLFLGCLGVELLGQRRAALIMKAAKGRLDTLDAWLGFDFRGTTLGGVGSTIAESVADGLSRCKALVAKLLAAGVVPGAAPAKPKPKASGVDLSGLSFCWTGTRELVDDVAAAGGEVKSGISQGLHYLVQKDATSSSNKTAKAESYGTKIIGVDFLRNVLAGKAKLPKASVDA